jgi:hypothetical protein
VSRGLPILADAPGVDDDDDVAPDDFVLADGPAAPPWPHQPLVEWQVVGQCNYDCSYCIQAKKHRTGVPGVDELRRALAFLAALPVDVDGGGDGQGRARPWEVKTTGGEPFSTRLFLDVVVPGLMDETPHRMSTLTNLSPGPAVLRRFAARTRGRLSVVSASLHLEHTSVDDFLRRLTALRDAVDDDTRIVVNSVLVPDRLEEVRQARRAVIAAGFRFFPQLMKVKGGVFAYSAAQMRVVDEIVGGLASAAATRSANLAPSYLGRRCFAGARYLVLAKDGTAWACRTARRFGQGFLGDLSGGVRLRAGAIRCPYPICPCTTVANRGMIEGVSSSGLVDDES